MDEGKLAIFEYDTLRQNIRLVQPINAEENAFGLGSELVGDKRGRLSAGGVGFVPFLSVDEHSIVAATIIYGSQLFFTPLRTNNLLNQVPRKPFLLRNLAALGIVGNILDIMFLKGYSRPTLAVLHETATLPLGHIAKVNSTVSLSIIAVDIYRRCAFQLWRQERLPHDSFRLVRLGSPELAGAVLVVSLSAIVIVASDKILAFAFNGFARQSVSKSLRLRPSGSRLGYELDRSRWVAVADKNSFLAVLKTGVVLHVRLLPPAEGSWVEMQMYVEQVAIGASPSCLCALNNGELLFVGSREADGLLIQAEYVSSVVDIDAINASSATQTASMLTTPGASTKKSRRSSRSEADDADGATAAEEVLLYGHTLPSLYGPTGSSTASFQVDLTITDSLTVLGAALDGRFSNTEDLADQGDEIVWDAAQKTGPGKDQGTLSYIVARETRHSLHVSAGFDGSSSIFRVSRGVRFKKLATRNFTGAVTLSVLNVPSSSPDAPAVSYIFVSFPFRTRVMRCQETGTSDVTIQEMQPTASVFAFVDSTVAVGMLTAEVGAQVFSTGIRVLHMRSAEALQDVLVEEELDIGGFGGTAGEFVCVADVLSGWIVCLTNKRTVYLFAYDAEAGFLELRYKGSSSGGEEAAELSDCIFQPATSVSFYYGLFAPHTPTADKGDEGEDSSATTATGDMAQVERYLYGHALDETDGEDDEAGSGRRSKRARVEREREPPAEKLFLLVCDIYGGLSIVDTESMRVVFRTFALSYALQRIAVVQEEYSKRNSGEEVAASASAPRLLRNARLHRVQQSSEGASSASRLCLVAQLDTYDLLVYTAVELDGEISQLLKFEHTCIARKRSKPKSPVRPGSDLKTVNRILVHDFGIAATQLADGGSGLFVSGPCPTVVGLAKGMLSVLPLSLPEMPFANTGNYTVVSISLGYLSGCALLWQEREEENGEVRMSKEATVGVYQAVGGQDTVSPASSVAIKKLRVGLTAHKCIELLPKTDDITEKALLKQKTLLLSCSEEHLQPFLPAVLTEEECEEEKESYDRFYPDLDSFCQPDREVAPPPPLIERQYLLVLVQGGAVIDRYKLREGEHVTDVTPLYLAPETQPRDERGNPVGPVSRSARVFIAASTSISDKHGEDSQGEGRLLFFTIDYAMFHKSEGDTTTRSGADSSDAEVKAEDASALDMPPPTVSVPVYGTAMSRQEQSAAQAKFLSSIQPKLRLAWEGPGPATAVRQLEDYILSTVGPTVYVYKLIPFSLELQQVAFFYAQFYIYSVSIIKNYICLGDACKSVQLLLWREEDYQLILTASDFDEFGCFSSGYLVDDSKLGVLVADDESNVKLLHYNPSDRESNRLTCTADFHLGSICTFMAAHRLLGAPLAAAGFLSRFSRQRILPTQRVPFSSRLDKGTSSRTSLVVGSSDGSLGIFIPVEERTYRRLALLQQILSMALETSLALNPREFRILKTHRIKPPSKKGVLDGTLLWRFVGLEAALQDELTAAMGTTTDLVLENLHELDLLTSFF